jgi:hypothetical protein
VVLEELEIQVLLRALMAALEVVVLILLVQHDWAERVQQVAIMVAMETLLVVVAEAAEQVL